MTEEKIKPNSTSVEEKNIKYSYINKKGKQITVIWKSSVNLTNT